MIQKAVQLEVAAYCAANLPTMIRMELEKMQLDKIEKGQQEEVKEEPKQVLQEVDLSRGQSDDFVVVANKKSGSTLSAAFISEEKQ